jgi:polysaccharide chain length determinant protein (PEP-CTERM system associated)
MNAPSIHTSVHDFLDQVRGAWRFRGVAILISWCVALALWSAIFLIPNSYQATARVFVDAGTTLGEATQGIGLGQDIDTQIQRVRQALLGGPQLRQVATETGILAGASTAQVQEQRIDDLRKDIDIAEDLASSANNSQRPSAATFTITYKSANRPQSLQVVSRLLTAFVQNSLGGKQEGSEQAEQFLSAQIYDYGRRLSEAEQRIADFKRRNVGLLPGQEGDYFTRLQSQTEALTQAKEKLALASRKQEALRRELQGGQPFVSGSASASRTPGTTLDTGAQIAQVQQQLDQLLLKYTDRYPDVIQLRETLKELQARQRAELAAAQQGDLGAATQLGLSANPVYQQLEEQYNQQQVDIATIQQEISDREQAIAGLRAMMKTAPEVEAQYAQLSRDMEVTRAQYNTLLQRLDRTRLGQQAAATGIVKFEVIEPPAASLKPVAPNRVLLILGALGIALAAGAGLAYLLHRLQPVFVSTQQLATVTGLQVLGAVGMAWRKSHQSRRLFGGALYFGAVAALVGCCLGVLLLRSQLYDLVRGLLA